MGGQSFKCPMCEKWYLVKGSLRDHIKAKHNLKNFHIVGTGPNTCINCDDLPPPCEHCGAEWMLPHKDDCPKARLRQQAQSIIDTIKQALRKSHDTSNSS